MPGLNKLPSSIGDVAASLGARAIHLVRENRLAHYLALHHAASINRAGLSLHCKVGHECSAPTAPVYVRVLSNTSRPSGGLLGPSCSVCASLPIHAGPDGSLHYSSYPWRATDPQSKLQCASLHDFIDIAIRCGALRHVWRCAGCRRALRIARAHAAPSRFLHAETQAGRTRSSRARSGFEA